MISILQSTNLAVRFVLELCALVAVGWWGWQRGSNPVVSGLLALVIPLLAATAWALLAAPGTASTVPAVVHVGTQVVVLGAGVAVLWGSRHHALATVFGSTLVLNAALMAAWSQ